MPGFDQTGPAGQGAMTGRRMGRCTHYGARLSNEAPRQGDQAVPEEPLSPEMYSGRGFGRGRGYGQGQLGGGRGRGFRNRLRGGG